MQAKFKGEFLYKKTRMVIIIFTSDAGYKGGQIVKMLSNGKSLGEKTMLKLSE